MKKIILIVLTLTLLLPSFVYGEGSADINWIVDKGFFGVGGLNLDKKINRAGLATATIRMMNLESSIMNYKGKAGFKDIENYQGGWATSYISLARDKGVISGKSKDIFNPSGNVTYTELLTIFMRVLGYEDGIDFVKYPDDYYKKALEIGLADMYISGNEEVLRETVLDTMVKTLNTNLKNKDYTLFESFDSIPEKENPDIKVSISDVKFNTLISGLFSGELKGSSNFTGYKIILLSRSGFVYEDRIFGKDGKFSISNFDIGLLAKLTGYKYEVYNNEGVLILESLLQ